jgi:hypothetical protein
MRIRRGSIVLVVASVLVAGASACSPNAAPGQAQPSPQLSGAELEEVFGDEPSPTPVVVPSPSPSPTREPKPTPKPTGPSDVLLAGKGTFRTAPGGAGPVGAAGALKTYQVQVEDGITTFTPDAFATKVDEILADSHSWIASKKWRFQRVPIGVTPSVYIRLVTPNTVDRLCATAGLDTAGKYSCRFGKYVIINLRRWTFGVPGFGTNLNGYRNMVVNHEVGHFLGFNHALCPGRGKLAPVMQQQTISLRGCRPNPYPYPDGVHFVN